MTFHDLGLLPELIRAVADEGYTEPTPIQREAIPVVLAGRDLLAAAQTGTGKTAAFVLPVLQRLHAKVRLAPGSIPASASRPARPPIRALVLTPTRELALQVEASFRTYGRHQPLRSVVIHGGVAFGPQVRALQSGPGIVVATPGRLLDHVSQRTIDLSSVEILVLDEADRMLDMGFIRDIRRVIALLPAARQNLLFSATFSDAIRTLAVGLLDRPVTVDVAPRNTPTELVDQLVVTVDRRRKRALLSHLIRSGRIGRTLVFTRTKHGANRLAGELEQDGIRAAAIHGNRSQTQRIRALEGFKSGRIDVLVATDIAARGIDIDALPHVVNFELPMVASDYIHRIGRTGRAGVGGRAVSLVCVDEAGLLRDIERLLRRSLPTETVAGFEPDRAIRPEPILSRQARPAGSGHPATRQPRRRAGAGHGPGPDRRYHTARPSGAPRPERSAPGRQGVATDGHARQNEHHGSDRRGGVVVAMPGERLRRAPQTGTDRWTATQSSGGSRR
jgi:ATP-dependent RNA helicase RhlE